MFKITDGKGFQITFENGYTVSVQFGPGNYADNYRRRVGLAEEFCGADGSNTAECAIFNPQGDFVPIGGDQVAAYKTPEEVLELLNWAAGQPSKKSSEK